MRTRRRLNSRRDCLAPTVEAASRRDSASPMRGPRDTARPGPAGRTLGVTWNPPRAKARALGVPRVTDGTNKGQAGVGGAELWTSSELGSGRRTDGRCQDAQHGGSWLVRRHHLLRGPVSSTSLSCCVCRPREEAADIEYLPPIGHVVF